GALEAGDGAQDALLVAPLEAALEADEVEVGAGEVLLLQLHHRVRPAAVGRGKPHRLHRSVAQRVDAAPRHLLDRQAALEEEGALEVMQRQHFGCDEGGDERLVLVARERRVEVVLAAALAVARGPEELREVERLGVDDGRDGVVEVEVLGAEQRLQRGGERWRSERAGGDHRGSGRHLRHLFAAHLDQRVRGQPLGDQRREAVAVDRQRAARRHRRGAGGGDHQRAEGLHLALEQAGRVLRLVAAQRVAADELGEGGGRVRRRRPYRPHLVQHHRHAAAGELPGALAAGEAAAHHLHRRGHAVYYRFRSEPAAARPPAPQLRMRRRPAVTARPSRIVGTLVRVAVFALLIVVTLGGLACRGGRERAAAANPVERLSTLLRQGARPGELTADERAEAERLLLGMLPALSGPLAGYRWRVAYDDLPQADFVSVDLLQGDGEAAPRAMWFHLFWRGTLPASEQAAWALRLGRWPARGVE